MKKLLMVVAAGLLSIGAMAQYRPSVIVNASYLGANITTNDKDAGNKLKSSYRAGLSVDLPVVNFGVSELSIQPGLYYAAKGFSEEFVDTKNVTSSGSTTLGYVEMPILANLSFGLGHDFAVFVNVGPYLAYGVNSSVSSKSNLFGLKIGGKSETDLFKKGDNDKSVLNPFDAGIQAGAGVEFHHVQLSVGTQYGLMNMHNMGKDKIKSTNSVFFVGLGYRF